MVFNVKKPDEMVKMKGNMSEAALKMSCYILSLLEKDKTAYKISIKKYQDTLGIKTNDYGHILNTAIELTNRQFVMFNRNNKKFGAFTFLSSVRYSNGTLFIEVPNMLLNYLMQIKQKYLQYDLKNIIDLKSKYSIRIYEILIHALNKAKVNEIKVEMPIEEFREMLFVPETYTYKDIRKFILSKVIPELNEKTDIVVSFEPKKFGRKVESLVFTVRKKVSNDIREFVKLIKKKYSGLSRFFGLVKSGGRNIWLAIENDKVIGVGNETIKYFTTKEAEIIFNTWNKVYSNLPEYAELVNKSLCLKEFLKNNPDFKDKLSKILKE